jgi:hypothetical protein
MLNSSRQEEREMDRISMEKPCIFLEQVEHQKYFSQGEPASPNGPAGCHIWYVEEDGEMYFLGFTEDKNSATEHYRKGSIPLYYKSIK